jgi:hypothetical protein
MTQIPEFDPSQRNDDHPFIDEDAIRRQLVRLYELCDQHNVDLDRLVLEASIEYIHSTGREWYGT